MSGFFLNQKSSFFAFLITAESGSLSHSRGNPARSVLRLPVARPCPAPRASADLSLLLVPFTPFRCRLHNGGAASCFLTGQNGSYWGSGPPPTTLSFDSSKPPSRSPSHQDGLVWSQTQAACGACPPARAGRPGEQEAPLLPATLPRPAEARTGWAGRGRPDLGHPHTGRVPARHLSHDRPSIRQNDSGCLLGLECTRLLA